MKNIILAIAIFLATVSSAFAKDQPESVYDRVMRTRTIHCGYLPYEPFLIKDANTGKLSGITYDYINEVARKNGLKVEWNTEVNIDQIVPNLNTGKIDAFCIPGTPDKNWSKNVDFSGGIGGQPYYVYVPQKSAITGQQLQTAKFAIADGYALTEITRKLFPKAQYLGLPQTTSMAEMYDQLRFGKVDAHINEIISATNYMKHNPGVIRPFSDKPVIVMKMFLMSRKGDKPMQNFLNTKFDANAAENLSFMQALLHKYHLAGDALLLGRDCPKSEENEYGWTVCTH